MVSEWTFPAVVFGKRPDNDRIDHGHELLVRDPEFTDQAVREVRRLARSFEWRPVAGDASPLGACYALWPVGEASDVIVARFLEGERDASQRSGTVRLEAVLITDPEFSHDGTLLGGLLHPEAWPEPAIQDDSQPKRTLRPSQSANARVVQAIERGIEQGRLPRLLVATHFQFKAVGFEQVITI